MKDFIRQENAQEWRTIALRSNYLDQRHEGEEENAHKLHMKLIVNVYFSITFLYIYYPSNQILNALFTCFKALYFPTPCWMKAYKQLSHCLYPILWCIFFSFFFKLNDQDGTSSLLSDVFFFFSHKFCFLWLI